MTTWVVQSGSISEAVRADDQWGAWDQIRDRDIADFGYAATAEPDENGDPFMVRASLLLYRWGRDDDARLMQAAAIANGYPDTSEQDRLTASAS